MFRKARAQTKRYQDPTVIVIFIVCDRLCGPAVIRSFRIWLEVQEEIGWETAGHPPAWPSPQSPSPQLDIWDQNGSVLTAALFEIYRKLPRQARVWGCSKNVMIFHLEMMHFTRFCRNLLSIVAGIFICLPMDLHLAPPGESGTRCSDSWILPEILTGYALFDFIWCFKPLSTVLLLYSWIITVF